MNPIIAPSILSADFSKLKEEIEMINRSEADWFHVDVMDGVFVPNISFGFPVMKTLSKYAEKPLDVHLMIVNPDNYIPQFAEYGAQTITVHLEACTHLHRTIELIKSSNCKAGVAINPHTPVSLLKDIIQDIDLALIMSVNPGFGGQKFIEHSYTKIADVFELKQSKNKNLIIEVDGGVDLHNLVQLRVAGADAFVAGNAIFSTAKPEDTIREMKSRI